MNTEIIYAFIQVVCPHRIRKIEQDRLPFGTPTLDMGMFLLINMRSSMSRRLGPNVVMKTGDEDYQSLCKDAPCRTSMLRYLGTRYLV
jgi:hypothetical protein